ncbi:MAG: hypothetical protein M9958_00485 [Chitinophagales bacterium]|nr:hypothetical protein [Chitinophagales bacterium]
MKKIFELHPDRDVVYQTSDGYQFWELSKAEAHSGNLLDKSIKTIHKADEEVPVEQTIQPEKSKPSKKIKED